MENGVLTFHVDLCVGIERFGILANGRITLISFSLLNLGTVQTTAKPCADVFSLLQMFLGPFEASL